MAVRGQDDDRGLFGLDRAEFGDRDLIIGKGFEKESFKGCVRAVDFVDQQHRRTFGMGAQRLQKRALDQKFWPEQARFHVALPVRGADREHLRRKIPLIDGGSRIEPLVALQPDQAAAKGARDGFGNFGLARARLPFEEDGTPQPQRQKHHRRKRAVGQIGLV